MLQGSPEYPRLYWRSIAWVSHRILVWPSSRLSLMICSYCFAPPCLSTQSSSLCLFALATTALCHSWCRWSARQFALFDSIVGSGPFTWWCRWWAGSDYFEQIDGERITVWYSGLPPQKTWLSSSHTSVSAWQVLVWNVTFPSWEAATIQHPGLSQASSTG